MYSEIDDPLLQQLQFSNYNYNEALSCKTLGTLASYPAHNRLYSQGWASKLKHGTKAATEHSTVEPEAIHMHIHNYPTATPTTENHLQSYLLIVTNTLSHLATAFSET